MHPPPSTIAAVLVSRRSRNERDASAGGGGGAPSYPSTALQFDGTYWTVVEGNTDPPDAYYVIVGSDLFIDDTATSGEPISVVGGDIFVGT